MPLSVMALYSSHEGTASDAEIASLMEAGAQLAPGESLAVRALDQRYLRIDIDDGGPPTVTMADQLPAPDAALMLTVSLNPADPSPESSAARLLDQLDRMLPPIASAAMDSRVHLDLVGTGTEPRAYAVIMNRRQQRHTRDEFIWYYRGNHTSLATDLRPRFVRYTTHRVMHSRGSLFDDGVTVQEFLDLGDFESHIATRTRSRDGAFEDIRNFVGRVDYMVGDRVIFLGSHGSDPEPGLPTE